MYHQSSSTENWRELLLLIPIILFASCSNAHMEIDKDTTATSPPTHYHVIVVSGFESDPTAEQIAGTSPPGVGNSGMFQLKNDLESKGLDCSFYNWNGTDAGDINAKNAPGAMRIAGNILDRIEQDPNLEFVFVGHSWGGHTLLEVANELLENPRAKIKFTVVVDPSSLMRGKRIDRLPVNIPVMINYHTANAFCWGAWKDEARVHNVDLGDSANGFSVNGHPNYGSAFDTHAHTAAEWDEKIHADACSRILAHLGILK